jgi:outer membrane protein OmpA-like peptidoglycan-associated protein
MEVRGKEGDPNMGKVLDAEVSKRAGEFSDAFKAAVESADAKNMELSHVSFEGETAALSADSKYELDNLVTALNTFPAVSVAVSASGSEAAARAASVIKYLTDRGVGADRLKAGATAESGVSLTISR